MRNGNNRGYGVLALFLITGAVLGGIIGELISTSPVMAGFAPYLTKTFPVLEVPPVTVNLHIIKFVLGFSLYPNLISIIGMITAIILFRRF